MENEERKIVIGGQNNSVDPANQINSMYDMDSDFVVPTEEIELPSGGIFYKDGKKTVKVKYLTAEEDDILFSPELLKNGRVLDALLQTVCVDKNLSTDDMLVGDRNAVLIHIRKTGLGEEYKPGKMVCPSCNENYEPIVDLNKLKLKKIKDMPDEKGEYSFLLPLMKKNIKFRFLNGRDENIISKASQVASTKANVNFKSSKSVTKRYELQIMEVEGTRDKTFIKKLITAMPMKDSLAFREYVKIMSPGVDFNYQFECSKCGHTYEDDVPMTYRLFYPNAEM